MVCQCSTSMLTTPSVPLKESRAKTAIKVTNVQILKSELIVLVKVSKMSEFSKRLIFCRISDWYMLRGSEVVLIELRFCFSGYFVQFQPMPQRRRLQQSSSRISLHV